MDIVRLKEKLEEIPDPRRPWGNIRHNLTDILVIGLATLLCNGSDYGDMELFAAGSTECHGHRLVGRKVSVEGF